VDTVNLGEGVGLMLEQGTFHFCPPRSDPALIIFLALCHNGTRSQTCALHSPLLDEHLSQNQSSPEVPAPIPQILTFHQAPTRILAEMQELYAVEGEDSNRVSPRVIVWAGVTVRGVDHDGGEVCVWRRDQDLRSNEPRPLQFA